MSRQRVSKTIGFVVIHHPEGAGQMPFGAEGCQTDSQPRQNSDGPSGTDTPL